jgi:hypothetical protein
MKQLIQYFIAIILWIAAIILWATGVTFWLLGVLLILHFVELLLIGYRTGRKYGLSVIRTIIFCMLYGYLWWLPIRRKMKEDEPPAEAFIEDGQEPWREKVVS